MQLVSEMSTVKMNLELHVLSKAVTIGSGPTKRGAESEGERVLGGEGILLDLWLFMAH